MFYPQCMMPQLCSKLQHSLGYLTQAKGNHLLLLALPWHSGHALNYFVWSLKARPIHFCHLWIQEGGPGIPQKGLTLICLVRGICACQASNASYNVIDLNKLISGTSTLGSTLNQSKGIIAIINLSSIVMNFDISGVSND